MDNNSKIQIIYEILEEFYEGELSIDEAMNILFRIDLSVKEAFKLKQKDRKQMEEIYEGST